MHPSGSFLYTAVDRVRHMCDTSETDRHSNEYIVSECLMPAFAETITELAKTDEHPLLMIMALSLVAGTETYILPPTVGEIWRMGKLDETTRALTHDWVPRHEFSPQGPGWAVAGNELVVRPALTADEEWLMFYVPSGDFLMHFGEGVVIDGSTIELAETPEVGQLDRRPNAYVGAVIRVLHEGKLWNERIIQSHDAETRRVTVRTAFDAGALPDEDDAVTYEIAPFCHQAMIQCLACYAALMLAPSKGFTQAKKQDIEILYSRAKRTLRDRFSNTIIRTGKGVERLTYDNPRLNDPAGVLTLWR